MTTGGTVLDALRARLDGHVVGEFSIRVRPRDPPAPDLIHADIEHAGEEVGWLKRRVIDNGREPLYVLHEELELVERYQGRGFGVAFAIWSDELYRELGVTCVRILASKIGGYAWARLGYEFDLDADMYKAAALEHGATTEVERRAAAVIHSMQAQGAVIERTYWGTRHEENGEGVLSRIEQAGAAERDAVRAFRERLPSPARIRDGDLANTFASPGQIADFDSAPEAQGVDVGRQVLLAMRWNGVKRL